MSDEQWLRDGLADVVPDPPANPDRARAAEGLARRRRTTALGALGATAVVVGGVALTGALLSGGDNGDDKVATSPPPTVECPPAKAKDGVVQESPIDQPDPDAPDAVPEGATSARICQGPGTTFDVPADPVTDVTALVEAVNALEPTGAPDICTLDLGPGFRIAFGYADGGTFVVSGRLYGCNEVVVGSGYRADARSLWSALPDVSERAGR